MKYKLFTTLTCPGCFSVKEFMDAVDIEGEKIDASTDEGLDKARELEVNAVPTVIFFDGDKELARAYSVEEIKKILEENK